MAGRPQDDEDDKEKVADEDDGKSDATEQTKGTSSRTGTERNWARSALAEGFLSKFLG